jgi:magnesium-transporting ATPase (P-type)
VLVATTVGSVFIIQNDYKLPQQRSQALNTLSFGAVAIMFSARFSYNSSFHPRLFTRNFLCWWSVATMTGIQLFVTYTPGLNSAVFGMGPMDGFQWLLELSVLHEFRVSVFIEPYLEKKLSYYFKSASGFSSLFFDGLPSSV